MTDTWRLELAPSVDDRSDLPALLAAAAGTEFPRPPLIFSSERALGLYHAWLRTRGLVASRGGQGPLLEASGALSATCPLPAKDPYAQPGCTTQVAALPSPSPTFAAEATPPAPSPAMTAVPTSPPPVAPTLPASVAPSAAPTVTAAPSARPRPEIEGRTGSLSGTIREADGRAAEGVSVRIRGITAGLRYDATFPAVGGVWWVQDAPTASRFEIDFTRGAWTTRRRIGPLGARELMVDLTMPADGPAPSASAAPLRTLTERPKQPCVFPAGYPSTTCTFEERPLAGFFDLQVPRTIKREQPAHARIALRFPDFCPAPYLDRFKAVIDERARTTRFEGASSVDSVYGCAQAVRVTSVYVPFSLPQAGKWVVLAVLPGTSEMELMAIDLEVTE